MSQALPHQPQAGGYSGPPPQTSTQYMAGGGQQTGQYPPNLQGNQPGQYQQPGMQGGQGGQYQQGNQQGQYQQPPQQMPPQTQATPQSTLEAELISFDWNGYHKV